MDKNDKIQTYNGGYNDGIDTAISLIKDCLSYDPTALETIICALEESKQSVNDITI